MTYNLSMIRDVHQDRQTKGQLFVLDETLQSVFSCFTLELPWKENQQNISCIPVGKYTVVPRYSEKYSYHLHILNVPGREWILIHEANYVHQLRGCIAVGRDRVDINGDGLKDVTSSLATKARLLQYIKEPCVLIISDGNDRKKVPDHQLDNH